LEERIGGLTNDELQKANKHILIPSSEEYPVLNIAMSVQVIAYEIFKNSDIEIDTEWHDYPELNSDELTMLIDHFIDTSYKLNLFDEENAKKILVRIKRMFTRLKPDKMEGNFLRGFLTRINKKIK
jgi:tRNA (cytidine32/uridine32-2'-O)-methyltransferase